MLPKIQGASEFFSGHGTAWSQGGAGQGPCVPGAEGVAHIRPCFSEGAWPHATAWGCLGMPKCITGTPKGPQSLASFSDHLLLEYLKALCSAKSVKIRQ